MKVYVDTNDKMTSYQWGYDEESKRYFVKINFDVPSDTKVNVLSISDYTKQVRKEVCEEIRNKIKQAKLIYEWQGKEITIENILNQLQGE